MLLKGIILRTKIIKLVVNQRRWMGIIFLVESTFNSFPKEVVGIDRKISSKNWFNNKIFGGA